MVFKVFSLIFRVEADGTHVQTTIDADGKIMTFFTQLCSCRQCKEQCQYKQPEVLYFHLSKSKIVISSKSLVNERRTLYD